MTTWPLRDSFKASRHVRKTYGLMFVAVTMALMPVSMPMSMTMTFVPVSMALMSVSVSLCGASVAALSVHGPNYFEIDLFCREFLVKDWEVHVVFLLEIGRAHV